MSELVGRSIAERLESGLRLSREQLALMLDRVAEGVIATLPDGRLAYANDAGARLLGYESAADVLGRDLAEIRAQFEVFDVDGAPLDPQQLPGARARRGEGESELLVRFRPAGGSPGDDQVSLTRAWPLLDESGEIVLVVSFFRPVTDEELLREMKEARAEAEAAATTLSKLEQIAGVALSHPSLRDLLPALLHKIVEVFNADTAVILLLDEARRALILRAAVGLDEQIGMAVPVPLGEGLAGHVAASRETLLVDDLDHAELVSPALRARGIKSVVATPLVVEDRVIGVVHAGSEQHSHFGPDDARLLELIADRVAAAVSQSTLLAAAEERAQAARVLAAVGDGVLLLDSGGTVRYWNRAAEAITGLPAADVLDRPVAEVIPGWEAVVGQVPVVSEHAMSARAQSLPLGLPGRELWLSVSAVAVADGVVYAFRDLTEDRALESLRTEFVSTVSHELRTPLAAIYGAAMTLRRGDVEISAEQRETLFGVIANESDRLARTVNAILWASRLDNNTLRRRSRAVIRSSSHAKSWKRNGRTFRRRSGSSSTLARACRRSRATRTRSARCS